MNPVESLIQEFRALLDDCQKKYPPKILTEAEKETVAGYRFNLELFETKMLEEGANLSDLIPTYSETGLNVLSLTARGFERHLQKGWGRQEWIRKRGIDLDRGRERLECSNPALRPRVERINYHWRLSMNQSKSVDAQPGRVKAVHDARVNVLREDGEHLTGQSKGGRKQGSYRQKVEHDQPANPEKTAAQYCDQYYPRSKGQARNKHRINFQNAIKNFFARRNQ